MSGNKVKTITVISGKGGTGKTSLAAGFAVLAKPVVMADCDVDAANLHLLLKPEIKQRHDFYAMPVARIVREDCSQCGTCYDLCEFDAILKSDDDPPVYKIDPLVCEACLVCKEFCPEGAVVADDRKAGEWFESETRFGPMVHAHLGIAQENSGKLVYQVRKVAAETAARQGLDKVIVDGPPGIGCAVIASITGADIVVAVTEATLSGLSDLFRVYDLADHFRIPLRVIINKADLNPEVTEKIKEWGHENNVKIMGEIPYDPAVSKAMVSGKAIVEVKDSKLTRTIESIWEDLDGVS
jgi:MinD superfamily P-loop ATPase